MSTDWQDLYHATDPGQLPKRPSYPYVWVILVYLFCGGAVGGCWMVVLSSFMQPPSDLFLLLPTIILFGALLGALPALLCGIILAMMRRYRGWDSLAMAALIGFATTAIPMLLIMLVDSGWSGASWSFTALLGACGSLSAASLAWVLPRKTVSVETESPNEEH